MVQAPLNNNTQRCFVNTQNLGRHHGIWRQSSPGQQRKDVLAMFDYRVIDSFQKREDID